VAYLHYQICVIPDGILPRWGSLQPARQLPGGLLVELSTRNAVGMTSRVAGGQDISFMKIQWIKNLHYFELADQR
jgi:hypothetical protein